MKSLNSDAVITTHTVMQTICDFLDRYDIADMPKGMSEKEFEVKYTKLLDNVRDIIRSSLDDVYSAGYAECYRDILGKAN